MEIETTGKALVDFWKRMGDKGDVNPNTANSYRGACAAVLGVLDNWQTVDIRTLDPDDVFRRFVNKNSSKFKQGSLQAYRVRWPVAVRSFLDYAKDPAKWKPPASERHAPKREKGGNGARRQLELAPAAVTSEPPPSVASGMVDYPFPLREGRLANLRLPVDLKLNEVSRLTAFLRTLAVDAPREADD